MQVCFCEENSTVNYNFEIEMVISLEGINMYIMSETRHANGF